ncbi:MAG TPA: helix-turn-helix domain-containing protein [Hyphomonadaceae bacterium]|nr:helix-turn-helix domain-containing protein [Hyphomonadaceae bacterium]
MARAAQQTDNVRQLPVRAKPRVDREARKADYLRAAAKAFLAKGAQASMQDVADAAGAPKPVFYRIFPSRADLIESFYQHIHDAIVQTQQGQWDGYGWALRVLYAEAKKEPEIFLVALKTFRGDPALEPWREKLFDLVSTQSMGFFRPSNGAPPGGDERGLRASRTLTSMGFDTLVSWLEDSDGLSDEKRFAWWGRIVKEWRKATREAFELDGPID